MEDEDMVDEDDFESTASAWKNTFEGLRRYFHYNSVETSSNSSESTPPSGFDSRSSEPTPSQPSSNGVDGGFKETESSLDSSAQNTLTKKETESQATTSLPTNETTHGQAADPKIKKTDNPKLHRSVGESKVASSPVNAMAEGDITRYRAQIREESFGISPEEMFDILLKPSAVKTWWGATSVTIVPEVGGILSAVWGNEDEPDRHLQANIIELERPERLVLKCLKHSSYGKDLPFNFADDAVTIFQVKQNGGECTLRVEQTGFPCVGEADQLFSECGDEWKTIFESIRKFTAH
ncbi:SRPBCC family protein [Leptolyngbya sp. 7M]|uniref:SRPBCC family protein n=1 Tax=Leptolyngbya sp. 7M TaxID=2812896 RepID=UPI001B8C78B9|nr:SRPBCC domain-containing protein [Leptolyngbya sp. 7M]QYO63504.1 SRPBCC domain-containing protein [Leptolyngbya sp. 7M]